MDSQPLQEANTCPHCGKIFKSINIHISKAHPQEYRKKLRSKYDKPKRNSQQLENSENLSHKNISVENTKINQMLIQRK